MSRQSYAGVAVAVPITVPYQRYSTQGAHWFVGQALQALIQASGIEKDDIDGLCLSSFSLNPDTAVGLTQHLGLSPRWLDHIPTGGASGAGAASTGVSGGVTATSAGAVGPSRLSQTAPPPSSSATISQNTPRPRQPLNIRRGNGLVI